MEPPHHFMKWVIASRPRTLPAAVIPVWIAVCLVVKQGESVRWIPAGLCLLFGVLIQIATNFSNDLEDYRKGADNEKRIGPDRAVHSGWITEASMSRAVWLTFGAAFLTGSLLVFYTQGYWIFGVGIASILAGYAYTGGPYPLGYRGLGDLFSMLFFGLLAVGATYYIQVQAMGWSVWLTGLAVGGLTTNLLVVNNHRDMETDREAGKRTLAVRFGRTFTYLEYLVFVALALLWAPCLCLWGDYGWGPFWSWIAFPFWIRALLLLPRAHSRETFGVILKSTSFALIAFGIGGGAGLLVSF